MTNEAPPQDRVLVVDDDIILRDVLSLLLGAKGYDVLVADSGDDALRQLESERETISIVLTDMHMPGISGVELAKKLQTAVTPGTALVGMSGSLPTTEERSAFRAFLEKPFSAEAFTSAVELAKQDRPGKSAPATAEAVKLPVLNEAIYARLASIMPPAQLRELYRMTLEDIDRRVDLMYQALTRGDSATCRAEAHSIKGGCGMVGAAELGALAAEVEHAAEPDSATLSNFGTARARLQDMLDARAGSAGHIPDGES